MSLPQTPSFRLDGRRALVAGASSGIGAACASALAEAGAHVVLAARSKDKLADLQEAMRSAGYKADMLALDVSDVPAIQAILKEEMAHNGVFDILLNSAGMARHTAALDTEIADFDAVINVNLKAAYFLNTTIAEALIAADKPGSLINISSQMAHVGGLDRAVYAASKHAVEGFTKSQAMEWGKAAIRVNTICPTFIRTALTQSTFDNPERLAWIMQKIKLGRVGEVEDIMGAAVFLASDASAMITGSALMIDGGWTAG